MRIVASCKIELLAETAGGGAPGNTRPYIVPACRQPQNKIFPAEFDVFCYYDAAARVWTGMAA